MPASPALDTFLANEVDSAAAILNGTLVASQAAVVLVVQNALYSLQSELASTIRTCTNTKAYVNAISSSQLDGSFKNGSSYSAIAAVEEEARTAIV